MEADVNRCVVFAGSRIMERRGDFVGAKVAVVRFASLRTSDDAPML